MNFNRSQIARLWKAAKMSRATTIQTVAKAILESPVKSNDGSIRVDLSNYPVEASTFLYRVFSAWEEYTQHSKCNEYVDCRALKRIIYGPITKIAVIDPLSTSVPLQVAQSVEG